MHKEMFSFYTDEDIRLAESLQTYSFLQNCREITDSDAWEIFDMQVTSSAIGNKNTTDQSDEIKD